MTINTTRWSPDTCECTVEYTWDSEATDQNRIHTLSNFVEVCPVHQALGTDSERWTSLLDENPRKNNALQHCLENLAVLSDTTPEGAKVLKSTLSFNFYWSGLAPDRLLTIGFTGINLTQNQRNALNAALGTRFGGRVLIA